MAVDLMLMMSAIVFIDPKGKRAALLREGWITTISEKGAEEYHAPFRHSGPLSLSAAFSQQLMLRTYGLNGHDGINFCPCLKERICASGSLQERAVIAESCSLMGSSTQMPEVESSRPAAMAESF